MNFLNIPLVSWVNGTIMIGVFVLVVIGLVAAVFLLMNSDKK
ncbi:MAG: Mg2+ and Co2+ transporter CorA, partial [Polaribacter sp.]